MAFFAVIAPTPLGACSAFFSPRSVSRLWRAWKALGAARNATEISTIAPEGQPCRWCFLGQTPKSDIPPNIAPKVVTPENYLQIWDSSATLIGQLAIVTLFGAILGGIPLSAPYPIFSVDTSCHA